MISYQRCVPHPDTGSVPQLMVTTAWQTLEQHCSMIWGAVRPWSCSLSADSRYPAYFANLSRVPLALRELQMPEHSTVLFLGTSLLAELSHNVQCTYARHSRTHGPAPFGTQLRSNGWRGRVGCAQVLHWPRPRPMNQTFWVT